MSATTRGRFGVTRDEDGSLSLIYEWPWYWRYPAAIGGAAACLWFVSIYSAMHGPNWLMLVLAGFWALACLSVAYEAFLLALFLGFVYGLVELLTWLFPGLGGGGAGWKEALGVGVAIYLVMECKALRTRLEMLEKTNQQLQHQLNRVRYPSEHW